MIFTILVNKCQEKGARSLNESPFSIIRSFCVTHSLVQKFLDENRNITQKDKNGYTNIEAISSIKLSTSHTLLTCLNNVSSLCNQDVLFHSRAPYIRQRPTMNAGKYEGLMCRFDVRFLLKLGRTPLALGSKDSFEYSVCFTKCCLLKGLKNNCRNQKLLHTYQYSVPQERDDSRIY